jgi:preprotein translocase subunit SecA
MLGILGLLWMNHLESLEALQESIGLRAYGHREPLVEFRREAHRLYQDFWLNFDAWIFTNLFRLTETARTDAERTRTNAEGGLRQSAFSPRESASQKVGRNDPCPCGAKRPDGRPYKYKQCGLINAPHHRK